MGMFPDDVAATDTVEYTMTGLSLMQVDGFKEFKDFMEDPANAELKEKMGTLMGAEEGAEPSTMDTLRQMKALADEDPEVFKNLNTVVQADGLEGFIDTLSGNETLMEGMQGQGPMDPSSATGLISGLAERVRTSDAEGNEPYFERADSFLTERAGLISTVGGFMGGSMSGGNPLDTLDMGMGLNDSFGGVIDFASGIFDQLMEFLGPLIDGLKGIMGQITESLGLTEAKVTSNPADDLSAKVDPKIQPQEVLDTDGNPVTPTAPAQPGANAPGNDPNDPNNNPAGPAPVAPGA
jgi:hypothetical protein